MIPVSYPDINGHRFSWVSIETDIADGIIPGLKSLNYSDNSDPNDVYGQGPFAIGRTRGKYAAEASFEIFLEEYSNLTERLGDGFGERAFNIIVQFSENENSKIVTHRLYGLRMKKGDSSNSQGTDPSTIKVDLSIIQPIDWNGFHLMRVPNSQLVSVSVNLNL